MKYAIIDIGSNSVRLMLWADGKSLYKKVVTTRLGEGLALKNRLSEAAMLRSARAVCDLADEGREQDAAVYAFATAAVRSAENGRTFCDRVFSACGVSIDIVSGEDEAKLGLFGALGAENGGIIDIGGASTEVCVQRDGRILFSVSLPVGAVRLFDKCGEDKEALSREIQMHIASLPVLAGQKMYCIGGTGSTLASVLLGLDSYDAERIQNFSMTEREISSLAERLLSMSAEERRGIRGMDIHRADIIGGGALLLAEIMKKTSLRTVLASDRDNLEGYLKMRELG